MEKVRRVMDLLSTPLPWTMRMMGRDDVERPH